MSTDSHNSHKPPSSDGYRKRPALPKSTGRKRGGQKGHQGKTLTMVEQPDRTVVCQPSVGPCGASLQHAVSTVLERRQVFDLPEPRLEVTEYHRVGCQCPICGTRHEGAFPTGVDAPAQYGPGVHAFATLLHSGYLLPFKKVRGVFADLFGYAVNESTVVTATTTASTALAASERAIREQIQHAPVCHVDETGIRVEGRLHWLHVASTASATYSFVHPNRGTD